MPNGCRRCNNLNADKVDGLDSTQLVIGDPARGGGRLIAGRRTAAVPGSTLLFIPGMGRLFFEHSLQVDVPVLMGVLLLSSALVILGNLVADLTYAWLDPRIRYR